MNGKKPQDPSVSNTHLLSSTISVKPEQLMSDITFEVTFPDGIPQIDLQEGNYSARDLAARAKRLGDRYGQLLKEAFDLDTIFMEDDEAFAIYLSIVGLTCELYIKSILYAHVSNLTHLITGHDICKLLAQAPVQLREQLKCDFLQFLPDLDYESELENLALFFRRFRYAYELDGYSINLASASLIMTLLEKYAKASLQSEVI